MKVSTNDWHYLNLAFLTGRLSKAIRKKVGCILVDYTNTPHLIGDGVNGTTKGDENTCEIQGKTSPDVIHAEINALNKLKDVDFSNVTIYVTHQPCPNCLLTILRKGIKRIVYCLPYKENDENYQVSFKAMCKDLGIIVHRMPFQLFNYEYMEFDYSGFLRLNGKTPEQVDKIINCTGRIE